ncbi:MAG TPA: PRC-barrel domain-containing protein [Acidimicrobiales bacterium]|jgi:uncharacterized protein YrrD
MTLLLRASELIGLPIVTVGGEDVSEVKDVVYGSEQGRLLGFTLNKRGALRGPQREVLPIDLVTAIGKDAVMIEDEGACLVAPAEAPGAVAAPEHDRNVLGDAVVTDAGVRLGVVRDLVLLVGGDGEAVGYELERDGTRETWFIPRPVQLAVSGDALVVPADIERFVRHDLVGFGAAVDDFRAELGGTPK